VPCTLVRGRLQREPGIIDPRFVVNRKATGDPQFHEAVAGRISQSDDSIAASSQVWRKQVERHHSWWQGTRAEALDHLVVRRQPTPKLPLTIAETCLGSRESERKTAYREG
jgi:hypothetical protein